MVHSEGQVAVDGGRIDDRVRLAVVVPAYGEERLLETTVCSIPASADDVIVVDDGSTDATWEVASGLARRFSRVRAVRLAFNRGAGFAICRGYLEALEVGADVVAVMAADAQMDPDDLEAVVEPVAAGRAAYSKGNRLAHPEVAQMPLVRRLGTRLLASLTVFASGYGGLRDTQCGYTAIAASLLRRLPLSEIYPSYGYPNDLLIRIAETEARIAQPNVRPIYADETSGLTPLGVAFPILGILTRGFARRLFAGR